MASVNWMKMTTQKASALKCHLNDEERLSVNHSNPDINTSLSHLNYAIGCENYIEAVERMKLRTKEVDDVLPPQRIRKDRITCCSLELPCPRILTEQGKSDEFFRMSHEIYKKFFGEDNVHGSFVHKDEVHEYTDKNGQLRTSCEHAHTLVSAFVEGKGINGKAFETRAKLKELNSVLDEACYKTFGIYLNTRETPERKSAETLKAESNAREELGRLNDEIEKADKELVTGAKKQTIFSKKEAFVTVSVEKYESLVNRASRTDDLIKSGKQLQEGAERLAEMLTEQDRRERELNERETALKEREATLIEGLSSLPEKIAEGVQRELSKLERYNELAESARTNKARWDERQKKLAERIDNRESNYHNDEQTLRSGTHSERQ